MTRVTVGFYVVLCKYAVSCSDFSVLFKLNFIDVIKFRMMGMLLVKKKVDFCILQAYVAAKIVNGFVLFI